MYLIFLQRLGPRSIIMKILIVLLQFLFHTKKYISNIDIFRFSFSRFPSQFKFKPFSNTLWYKRVGWIVQQGKYRFVYILHLTKLKVSQGCPRGIKPKIFLVQLLSLFLITLMKSYDNDILKFFLRTN